MLPNIISRTNPIISTLEPWARLKVIPGYSKSSPCSPSWPTQTPRTCTPPTYTGVSVQKTEPGQMREISVFGKPPQKWDTKAVNKSNGMPDQMCSTFAKITKLSHEERFMCLLLAQSFPRYFLSIPPKLNPAQTAAIFVSTQHRPNALQSH